MGTLRFDLNTLATAKTGKEEKKAALALRKDFIRSVSGDQLALPCSMGAVCALSRETALSGLLGS
jgi:hypothetical protein